ncbi:MAG: type II secretion system ATPase GspE [Burkholderiaceae bacterium]|jgi:general secretion pathway protein E
MAAVPFDVSDIHIHPGAVNHIPFLFARQNRLLCTQVDGADWQVWITATTPPGALTEVQRACAGRVQWMICEDAALLEKTIQQAYSQQESSAAQVADEVSGDLDLAQLMQDLPAIEDLLETEDDAPIIRMINALLTQSSRDGASDIHIEPFETHSAVRFRIDGTLRDVLQPRRELHAALIARIKIMASLDIAEKRLPQDGRITLRIGGRPIDVRVSTLPTGHGERAVLRLLDKDAGKLELTRLGMATDTLAEMDRMTRQPHGILLVTGPTGSGKTTTLYAAMSRLDAAATNIMTVEDPIEYDLPGVSQTPVNVKIDMTFAAALRAILRQDPDVVMIGEIRDLETAQIAVQASLTGHLVLATLHTNDAVSAVTRLIDLGVEPFLLSSSLLGVLAQRLIRRLCVHCRKQDAQGLWHPQGCERCNQTGYSGRSGIYELLTIDEPLRELIHGNAPESDLRKYAIAHGMRQMRQDGQRWVDAGTSSLEEVLRATRD